MHAAIGFVIAPLVVSPLLMLSLRTLEQDPRPKLPKPPQDARKLPPVLEPARNRVERRDLLQDFRERSRLEGTYRLKRMVRAGGGVVKDARGYLMLGGRHLSMHLYAPAGSPDKANIQAVFRKYRILGGDQLVMSTLLGHRNKDNGDIALEPISYATKHRFVLLGAVLKLYRAKDEYLEFERIE